MYFIIFYMLVFVAEFYDQHKGMVEHKYPSVYCFLYLYCNKAHFCHFDIKYLHS